MRTTNKIANNNSLSYLNRNNRALLKATEQISMNQQVTKLQDNPVAANLGLKMTAAISKSEQYLKNVDSATASLGLIDGYLASIKSVMDEINVLAIEGAQDTSASARKTLATQLGEMLKSIVSAGNASDGSRYLFGGQNTTTAPFSIVNGRYVCYNGTNSLTRLTVDNSYSLGVNSSGTDVFGNMTTSVPSKDMNPSVNLSTDHSTKLADLNSGDGVPKGKIMVYYSAYPDGLEVDLSGCDTLEDVKDAIEHATLEASRNLDPAQHAWIDGTNLDWKDLTDRYVKVTVNPEGNGISLQEIDLGEPLPEPTAQELQRGLSYSGTAPGYTGPGDTGIAAQDPSATGGVTVYDKQDLITNPNGGTYYGALRVDDVANNKVAEALGIKGTAKKYDPNKPNAVLDGFIHGKDLDPVLSDRTLLSDLDGYNDSTYTITNGGIANAVTISETSNDSNNVFNNWKINGLNIGQNTGSNGELYARAVNKGTASEPDIVVEIYTKPLDKATSADLVASGTYTGSGVGGTVVLQEANNSGLSGSVGIVLPETVGEASVDLSISFDDSLQASIHVPAFEVETADRRSRDTLNIASGWNIKGLTKPPASGYSPASTDLNGNVSVNYRYDEASNSFIVELVRPAYDDQPAAVIATGNMYLGDNNGPPLTSAVSGRVEFTNEPGFEGVGGSVYVELPAGSSFSDPSSVVGDGAANATTNDYLLTEEAPRGDLILGGATQLVADLDVGGAFTLAGDTVFLKGQVFENDIILPGGRTLRAGTPLSEDTLIPKGTTVQSDGPILAGTVLPAGQSLPDAGPLAAGTVIPAGSYYSAPTGAGFPAGGMGVSVTQMDSTTGQMVTKSTGASAGYNVRATFATVEDLKRAVQEAGIYVNVEIGSNGKSLEFTSQLAGAWLTVSEDTDCYEQMGDVYQQLTGLDLNGMVKGVNTDNAGNVYTEVIYYPPDPNYPDRKITLVNSSGDTIEIEPGYYVRVYSDPSQMALPFEDRDNTTMVAEGFVPAGQWNPDWDASDPDSSPFIADPDNGVYNLGFMNNLVLEERNGSGVSGTVNLDYYAGGASYQEVTVQNPDGTTTTSYEFSPYNNDGITVFPGGLRPAGSWHTTIQEVDIYTITPGVTCDYNGTIHGQITRDTSSAAGVEIRLYKDSTQSVSTARNDPSEAPVNGKIVLYQTDEKGKFVTDLDGNRIVAGTMAIPEDKNNLPDGESESFTLATGAARNTGQEREENLFSTINDLLDALNRNDSEAINALIGNIATDVSRVTDAAGDVGSRMSQLDLLKERHTLDILNFNSTLTSSVGMDETALMMVIINMQSSTNALSAAMQVSGTVMQMSLLNYI